MNEHDKAYRWAEGRRVKLDKATNRIRIVEEIEQNQETVITNEQEPDLFSDFKDKKLVALGVAEEAIALARCLNSETDLDEAQDRFDPLSFQVLYALAAGYSEEEVYALVGDVIIDLHQLKKKNPSKIL